MYYYYCMKRNWVYFIKITNLLLISLWFLSACNPAFVTGMAKGLTEQLERRSIQRSSERKVYGMTKSKANDEFQNMYQTLKNCLDTIESNFIDNSPEYKWFVKDLELFTARDYADNTKVSGEKEKEALLNFNENEMKCFNKSLSYISNNNMIAQEIILPLQIVSTEGLISTAKYVNGEVTKGEMRQVAVKLKNDFEEKAQLIVNNIRQKSSNIQNDNVMINLQRENNRISRELANRPLESIKRYRPIFCHQYYTINTISCY